MKLIELNPFRMLGIPVNATAGDRAANKSKMRLLDIGKAVEFPLDLSSLMAPVERTKEAVATAERDINQPQDMVRHALFWFAKPSDPIGAMAFDNLLQGNIDTAVTNFKRSTSWEAKLCLATIYLIQGDVQGALSAIAGVIDGHSDEFVMAVAGQTYKTDADTLRHDYVSAIAEEMDVAELYAQLSGTGVPDGFLSVLRDIAVDAPIKVIEKEIAAAKSIDSKDAPAQLKAGKTLMKNTQKPYRQLKQLVGQGNPRYSHLVDKLANQIIQCSINYFNNIEGENREIIENALKLGEYSLKIAVGKMAKDHILHNVEILRKKKEDLPPVEVEDEDLAIKVRLVLFAIGGKSISDAEKLMKDCAPYIVSIKEKSYSQHIRNYYLRLSTLIVDTALSCVINEHNRISQEIQQSTESDYAKLNKIRNLLEEAWHATLVMDKFDKEPSFRDGRYFQSRNAIKDIIKDVGGVFLENGAELIDIFDPHAFGLHDCISNDEFDLRTEDEIYDECKNAKDFRDYIDHYPIGKHIDEAKKRYDDCLADECTTISDCNNYLKEFPRGRHGTKIRSRLEELTYKGCKDKSDFNSYLKLYPNGRFVKEAKEALNDIEYYYSCKSINDYRNYITYYPRGRFVSSARRAIDDMTFNFCTNKKEWREYLQQFPNGRHRNEAQQKINEGNCYIATMVYGDYDHPQVMVLRGFRDDVLLQHRWGRAFVRFYYRNSPTWVEYLKDKKMASDIIRKILDGFIKIYKHEK